MDEQLQYSKSEMIDFSKWMLEQLLYENKTINGSKKYILNRDTLEKTCVSLFRKWDGDTKTYEVPFTENTNTNITKQK